MRSSVVAFPSPEPRYRPEVPPASFLQLESLDLRSRVHVGIGRYTEEIAVFLLQYAIEDCWGHPILNKDGILGHATIALANRLDRDGLIEAYEKWLKIWDQK